jgi:hypothetical protein
MNFGKNNKEMIKFFMDKKKRERRHSLNEMEEVS